MEYNLNQSVAVSQFRQIKASHFVVKLKKRNTTKVGEIMKS